MKTALVLGGGGARGAYEIGVWQALRELGIQIDIVTGTSVGALNGSVIVQGIFDEAVDLWKSLDANSISDIHLDEILDEHIDEDLIRKSPVEFGIVTVELPKMQPRYFFKEDIPKGKMIDFLQASASFFPAIKTIDDVKYIDGGYQDNLPVDMAVSKGATHIIAADLDSIGLLKKSDTKLVEERRLIKCKWPLGSITVFDKNNSIKIMRLGYLDTMKSYGAFDGSLYTFIKGTVDKRLLNAMECAGQIFELDPSLIYSKSSFQQKLRDAFLIYTGSMDKEISSALAHLRQRRLRGGLAKALKQLNAKTLTVVLFRLISDGVFGGKNPARQAKSPIHARAATRLFPSEMAAAGYLHRYLG